MNARESLEMLNKAQDLAAAGQHAGVLELLGARPEREIEQSPTLALLYGIAHARLGQNGEGERWVRTALERSRERGDRAIEARALNVSGAIALESGRVEQAADYFMRALAEAKRQGDHATVGRCSNNLGIIANMRGDYGRAIGSYTAALAAFQQADSKGGVAQTLHNMAITYRDQGDMAKALETADRAVREAEAVGDRRLAAATRGGRAEIRLLAGDPKAARREIERGLETNRELGNRVAETEDLRVWAGALGASGEVDQAESVLRDVIERAAEVGRPLLAAQAERDLARLLADQGRRDEAVELARKARVRFSGLGADAEVRRLDEFLSSAEQ